MPARLPYSEFQIRGYAVVKTPFFSLKAKRNTLQKNRIGVVVGAAAVKSAVRRNFWKRQVKNLFEKQDMQKGTDILVIFSSRISSLTKKQFENEFKKALVTIHA